ncbi:MAG TPA: hypothetical protein VG148_03595 [Pyrinomonadaceae bacterium]|nr:hypothetical protein [Pyrinomonadaceae bacterium]
MFSKLGAAALCLFLYSAEGCGSRAPGAEGQPTASPPAASATPGGVAAGAGGAQPSAGADAAQASKSDADVCGLLQNSEVEAVQGGKVSAARPVSLTRGPLAVAQCHYTVTAPERPGQNLGVLLEVRRPAAGDAKALGEEWQKLRDKKENKRSERPRAVEGLGGEAFWVGSEKLGALYVLAHDRLIYVSVGGPPDSVPKLERSKQLALKALARL